MSKKKKKKDMSMYEDRAALCPHFEVCGGCSLQKISYSRQLQLKAEEVCSLLGMRGSSAGKEHELHAAVDDPASAERVIDIEEGAFEGILPSPSEEGYRNKMEFTFGDEYKGGPFALGLHMRGSFMNIVNITDCHLVHSDLNRIRNAVRDFFEPWFDQGLLSFRNNKTGQGYLRHLLLRRAVHSGEIMAALVTTSQVPDHPNLPSETELLSRMAEMLLSLPLEGRLTGILHIVNDARSDTVQSDHTELLYGRDYIMEEVLNLKFRISVFSFFQTNTRGAEILYTKAREYAADAHGTLFDLYSGTGTIAQLMSPAVRDVIGVEIVPEAVDAARENARLNGIKNARFIAGDVLKVLDSLPLPDYLILDPPREGINPKALGKILHYGVPHIVYISCKPSSLVRDLQSFCLAGYQIKKFCCVDMFPQTEHVESCVLLERVSNRKADSYVKLNVKMADYYRIKDSAETENAEE